MNGDAWPGLAIHPGEMLDDEIEARELTQRRLAAAPGRPVRVVNEIVRGKKSITADTAVALERALGISAKMWMNLQSDYELTLAFKRAAERDLAGAEQASSVSPSYGCSGVSVPAAVVAMR